jgi:hypothetical protein
VRSGCLLGGLEARVRQCDAAFASDEADIGQRPIARANPNPSDYRTRERVQSDWPGHNDHELSGDGIGSRALTLT